MSRIDDELERLFRKVRVQINALPAEQRAELTTEDLLRLSLRVLESYHVELLRKLAE